MNIVLVVFDSLRKDCLGAYGAPPWGKVHTPSLDAFAREAMTFTRVYGEALPTLPARRALYTGRRVFPFRDGDCNLKGDFHGSAGWGPIPEDQDTLAELLRTQKRSTHDSLPEDQSGYRTALISDVYHMFKPSKNFWRGFDQWMFLRGKETDTYRSGPEPTQAQIDHWLAPELQVKFPSEVTFIRQCLKNMYGRDKEEDYFVARVMTEASRWLEQNRDASRFFLVVESFDPHEPWFVPEHYRRMYDDSDGQEQVVSPYDSADKLPPHLLRRAQANYSGMVTMCDRWFGYFMDTLRVQGLLDDTLIIVTSDHGHSLGDGNYIGKHAFLSHSEVHDIVLMVRHPQGIGAGRRCDFFLQHTDISAQILQFAGVRSKTPIDGMPFWQAATGGGQPLRDHVTVGWGPSITVIDDHWWLDCKANGQGVFLYDLASPRPFASNVADKHPADVHRLFHLALNDAGGSFPEYLLSMAANSWTPPGCSDLVALE